MPVAEQLSKMLIDGGEKLTFAIKAHKTLTHEINPSLWENEAKTYLAAVEPLIEAKMSARHLFGHTQFDKRAYLVYVVVEVEAWLLK